MTIHPTAIIEEGATIGEGTTIGPFCVIGADVTIGKNNVIHSNVVIDGNTSVGDDNEIFPYACIGQKTQDAKFEGGKPGVKIGDRNNIREYATVHCATYDGDFTTLGSDCLIQAYCHVAHDCQLSDNVILSSGAKLSGHVEMGKHSIISGMTGVIQFVKVGEFAFVGGYAKLTSDVPPFCIADGIPAKVQMVNKIGLERNGFSKADIRAIYNAYKAIFKSEESLETIKEQLDLEDNVHVQTMLDFINNPNKGILRK
ncbi:Acyl-[acyl-carrier-protein]--UDP-N-acetylglucosamine O-acyltransferase [BD1-7 clade bacterium]|uniref:Acyl-[acyl-carrier-protein]--UDP-N-acetylglucosamine O-acyltransferase n=1 Tax=BD1-7 clade bacterium TaxID=2029982 RepID=A0A5S9PPX0_9GAMM|nr:Acyl-[acyl-carrier-protein]--UDP-N-acetylglucosamine O-acyltransferase [BD1-7 clade bacterium]CAA0106068.1 Acyl-[acyl-carrier-protein]--UDP-N-acetylglucosamine O-acyltransferase [BD1-7 clade bacterium]CAA0125859.1 Acyl-[acyl-carrier-protein]--UDP-N-acetylglucosamine O-acyltransferase [BD1-7 clade bacterium]